MASRFILPYADVGSGITPRAGAKLYFYGAGLDPTDPNKKNTYSDEAATTATANSNPVIANASGVFPDIWLVGDYKVILKTKSEGQIWVADPVRETDGTSIFNIAAYDDYRNDLNGFSIASISDGDTVIITGDGIAGIFVAKSGVSTDDGATILTSTVDTNKYIQRIITGGEVDFGWWEPTVGADAAAELTASLSYAIRHAYTLTGTGKYLLASTVTPTVDTGDYDNGVDNETTPMVSIRGKSGYSMNGIGVTINDTDKPWQFQAAPALGIGNAMLNLDLASQIGTGEKVQTLIKGLALIGDTVSTTGWGLYHRQNKIKMEDCLIRDCNVGVESRVSFRGTYVNCSITANNYNVDFVDDIGGNTVQNFHGCEMREAKINVIRANNLSRAGFYNCNFETSQSGVIPFKIDNSDTLYISQDCYYEGSAASFAELGHTTSVAGWTMPYFNHQGTPTNGVLSLGFVNNIYARLKLGIAEAYEIKAGTEGLQYHVDIEEVSPNNGYASARFASPFMNNNFSKNLIYDGEFVGQSILKDVDYVQPWSVWSPIAAMTLSFSDVDSADNRLEGKPVLKTVNNSGVNRALTVRVPLNDINTNVGGFFYRLSYGFWVKGSGSFNVNVIKTTLNITAGIVINTSTDVHAITTDWTFISGTVDKVITTEKLLQIEVDFPTANTLFMDAAYLSAGKNPVTQHAPGAVNPVLSVAAAGTAIVCQSILSADDLSIQMTAKSAIIPSFTTSGQTITFAHNGAGNQDVSVSVNNPIIGFS
jgi:hypothetical protein